MRFDPPPVLVLASASASRKRVLNDASICFEAEPSGVNEDTNGLSTADAVLVLAERKAAKVAGGRSGAADPALVLGCDSLLDLEGESLGKPGSAAEATEMWRRLSGREGTLFTGHFLIDCRNGRRVSRVDRSAVRFGSPSEAEIARLVATGEPEMAAGGFTSEGFGAPYLDAIDGSPTNVLGLSLPLLRAMLGELGVGITELWRPPEGTEPLVRDLDNGDREWLSEVVRREWGLPVVSISGIYDPASFDALVAEDPASGRRLGVLTYRVGDDGLEVVTLNSKVEGVGAGSALLAEARRRAAAEGRRMWLVTTNDNPEAIGFYQRRGMDLVALHRGFAEVVRSAKPDVGGEVGGITFRHAIELEYPAP